MPKRCIGIDIGRSHLRAAQVARTPEGVCLEKTFAMQTRRSTDSLPGILHSLTTEHGFDRRAEIAISLPHNAFFFADIQTDGAGLERLRQADTPSLKDRFPIPADDIAAQVCSVLRLADGKHSVLVAATSVESLGQELRHLDEGNVRPGRVETPITAAHLAVITNHPESTHGPAVILYVDASTLSLAVTYDGNLLLVRSIPMLSTADQGIESLARDTAEIVGQEIEITWKRLFGNAPDAGLAVFLIASREMAPLLAGSLPERIDSRIVPVDPCATIVSSEGVELDSPMCIAEGLALRSLGPNGKSIDFLGIYHAKTRPHLKTARELKICGALAAAAAAVWVIGLFLQLSSLESQHTRLKKQAEAVFRRAVPEETNIVNPAVQLQQKLDAFRREGEVFTGFHPGRPAPLEILYALSECTPAGGGLKLHDVLIAADSVRILGSCDSFGTLSEWQRLLEQIPGLRVVDVPTPKKDAESGKVQFTISLSSVGGKVS